MNEYIECASCSEISMLVDDEICSCSKCNFSYRMLLEKESSSPLRLKMFEGDFFELSESEKEKILMYSNMTKFNGRNPFSTSPDIYLAQRIFYAKLDGSGESIYELIDSEKPRPLQNFSEGWVKDFEETSPKSEIDTTIEDSIISDEDDETMLIYYGEEISLTKMKQEIQSCQAIRNLGQSPFIVPLEEVKEHFERYSEQSCMIDLDNKIAYINISHKALMELIFDISKLVAPFDFLKMNKEFHTYFNMIEISVAGGSQYITSGYEKIIKEFKEDINNFNFSKFDELTILEERNRFITINSKEGLKSIKGEIYYPSAGQTDIPENSFIIIPQASEEYILPSLSLSGYKGCVIAEKGSKAAHLASLSKDIGFNMILIPDATKRFIEGDMLILDFEYGIFE